MTEHLHCTSDEPCENAEPQNRHQAYEPKMLDQPFWKVMTFVFVGLVSIAVYVLRSNMERLDKVNEGQIEMKTMLRVVVEQQQLQQTTAKEMQTAIEQLKLNDRTQQERLDSITRK